MQRMGSAKDCCEEDCVISCIGPGSPWGGMGTPAMLPGDLTATLTDFGEGLCADCETLNLSEVLDEGWHTSCSRYSEQLWLCRFEGEQDENGCSGGRSYIGYVNGLQGFIQSKVCDSGTTYRGAIDLIFYQGCPGLYTSAGDGIVATVYSDWFSLGASETMADHFAVGVDCTNVEDQSAGQYPMLCDWTAMTGTLTFVAW